MGCSVDKYFAEDCKLLFIHFESLCYTQPIALNIQEEKFYMRIFENFQKGVNLGGWISQFDKYDTEHFDTFITIYKKLTNELIN